MGTTCTRQLVFVKYLFRRGEDALDIHDEIACGVAVSHFQDAVEMFLYTVVRENGLEVRKDQRGFPGLWQVVDRHLKQKLPFHVQMMELNTARVQFKHNGMPPAPSVAERCLLDARRFLVEATQVVFGEDFESISLVDLIANEEMKAALKRAEHHLVQAEFSQCIDQCRKAHELASAFVTRILPRMSQTMSVVAESNARPGSKTFVDLGNYVNVLREISLAAILGISADDFFRYAALDPNMPLVIWDYFGEPSGVGTTGARTTEYDEDARFALRYVTDYVLAIETHIKPMR